jgi:glycine betaine/proline transport system permease protein/glycine betaine/proline transport system substrate-binding protein
MDYLLKFPDIFTIQFGSSIDNSVRAFARTHRQLLDAFRSAVVFCVNLINDALLATPWWVLILVIAYLGYKTTKKWRNGVLYGSLVFLIGAFGLWILMLETLSIIALSIIVSIVLGFPLGVAVAMSEKVNSVVRPILDLAQTIPTFVYLIPAAMLLGVGKTPAVIATVSYAIVPMVRMTSHGIVHVDKDIIEASAAFGCTGLQTLVKVQIPQALPTIMTGVNQTIMMAMAMVVTCALIGANGLGMEILVATNRAEIGRALMPGLSIVILATILDRITQGLAQENQDTDVEADADGDGETL